MKHKYLLCLLFLSIGLPSCKKYLDEKPDKKLVVPTTVQDLQGILDNYFYMNIECSDEGEIASDNYYMTDISFLALSADRERNAYLWKPGIFTGYSPTDWQNEYTIVYNANLVLDNIGIIQRDAATAIAWDYCKGSALLFRGKSFYEITQIWTKAYDSSTARIDLGIPLRLTSNFNTPSVRANIKDTYNQIISDLQTAIPLLPNIPTHPYRPSKAAGYGLLARTYLAMRDFNRAKLYADSCLQINKNLLDYNNLDTTKSYPFSSIQFTNPEDIMHSACVNVNYDILPWSARIDSSLFQSYTVNDLRKILFFNNSYLEASYQGSYDGGTTQNYNGIATDEMYLIRSECTARLGDVASAIDDLNTLLAKRLKTGTFKSLIAASMSMSAALNLILTERRKELVFRTLRFTDLKRLNKEGANITLERVVNGQTYTLPPNDPRYALPIPNEVIQLTGMPQN